MAQRRQRMAFKGNRVHAVVTLDPERQPVSQRLAPDDNRASRCGSEQMPPPGKRTLPPYPMEIAPMNLIVWLVVGGLIGWIASMLMGTSGQQGIILNIVVGIVGAFLGGWLLGGLFGTTTINEGNFSLGGVIVSLLGASILIGAVRLIRSP